MSDSVQSPSKDQKMEEVRFGKTEIVKLYSVAKAKHDVDVKGIPADPDADMRKPVRLTSFTRWPAMSERSESNGAMGI